MSTEATPARVSPDNCLSRFFDRLKNSRLARVAYRYRLLLPVGSFGLGAGSYFLVERHAALAQWLTALMLIGWVALLFEGLLCRALARYLGERMPQIIVRYGAQALHQETLFFVLPFFLATTTWSSMQAVFTSLLIVSAVASTIDPIYYEVIAPRRWLFLGFHALTLFAALLTGGPIFLSLTTGQSIELAAAAMAVCALPSFNDVVRVSGWGRWFVLAGLSIALGFGAWGARFWIPPATLTVQKMAITQSVNTQTRVPGPDLRTVSLNQLQQGGLYAFSAIKAPRGLNQGVFHVWSHNGKVAHRVALKIEGGLRKAGYRSWSHIETFGPNAVGKWRVSVVTDEGQLIGAERFRVVK
jgi:hypothetical protein